MKKILAATLIAIIAVIMIVHHLNQRKPNPQSMLIYPRYSTTTCTRILFRDRSDTTMLIRRGTIWDVMPTRQPTPDATGHQQISELEYPADTALVEKALSMIATIQRQDLISSNPAKQAEFQVDSGSALFMECLDSAGASLGGAYIGKTAETYDSYYVRPTGSNDVYSVPGGIRFAFFANRNRWLDKSIVPFDLSSARAIKIESRDSGTIELVKTAGTPGDSGKNGEWMITAPVKVRADAKKVQFLLNSIAQFKTVSWEGNMTLTDSAMGFTRPSEKLTVSLANGVTKSLIIGGDKVAMKWIRNPDMPKITFTAYAYTMHMLDPGLAGLEERPAIPSK